MDITDQPKPTPTNITDQVPHSAATPPLPDLPNATVKRDVFGYLLVVLGVVVVTVLLAIVGGRVLVTFAAIVAGIAAFHYWTWGRSLTKKAAEQQARELRGQIEADDEPRSEVERPRHY